MYIGSKQEKMEILYFLMGALTLGSVYSLYKVVDTSLKVRENLSDFLSLEEATMEIYDELTDEQDNLNLEYQEIQETLSKDSYKGIKEVNERINSLVTEIETLNSNFKHTNRLNENSFKALHGEVILTKKQLNNMADDPRYIDRY